MKTEHIEKLIELGYAREAYQYNQKFDGYLTASEIQKNQRDNKVMLQQARRIQAKYTWEEMEAVAEVNEDFEYAVQFL